MSVFGENQMSLFEEDDMETETKSPIQQERPASPVPSCVSMKSDWSMEKPTNFRQETNFMTGSSPFQQERPASPVPSCVSMKSDWSMEKPAHFRQETNFMTGSSPIQQERPASPVPSCLSMKSDWSMEQPDNFRQETNFMKGPSPIQQERPTSPVPSCVSMKSDWSMEQPANFRQGTNCMTGSRERERSKSALVHSNQSEKNTSESETVSGQSDPSHYLDLFTLLEEVVVTFVKKELKQFKRILSSEFPDGLESQSEDQEVVDPEYQKQESSAREGALKITLYALRNMKENKLADTLERIFFPSDNLALKCQQNLKSELKEKFQTVFEGIAKQGNPTLLNNIYTELYITEGGCGEVNNEHEVNQIEAASRQSARPERSVICNDIFKPSPGQDTPIRTVLTKGVAGIGKTISVQKFITDWAEGRANEEIQFIFPLPFRELNLMKGKKLSLIELLHHFFIETIKSGLSNYEKFKVLFVFDGLDECRLLLDFKKNMSWCDVTEPTSVDVLLTNLIKGKLLPSALVWITTRPAAANQIPSECVDLVTEVRGFNDLQKDNYFMKKCKNEVLARRIISHIKSSRTLYIMCHIPVFSWISATVLEYLLSMRKKGQMPKTLTEMYIHFLVLQTKQKKVKYHEKTETDPHWDEESIQSILSLGKLAFYHLEKSNLIFYEKDLMECGIDVHDASVCSGVFTQIFREESGVFQDRMFCFVHLSIQEFLAALFVFLSFINNNENVMADPQSTHEIHVSAVDKALQSENGHLDLFLRFLLGLSLESNQKLLRGLLLKTRSSSQNHEETVKYIKEKIRKNPSPDRCIGLLHCLNELNDHSLVEEIQDYLRSDKLYGEALSPAQWSALVFVLLTSVEELDVFDLRKYSRSEEGLLRLLPVAKAAKTALLSGCGITERGCGSLASALRSNPSHLRKLDLSHNHLGDFGVTLLSAGLKDPHCKLETLRLSHCKVTEEGWLSLVSGLKTNPSHLRDLDLSYNHPGDSGVKLLFDLLIDPHCRMESLRLSGSLITEEGCRSLSSALRSNSSHLRELDLSDNNLQDSGIKFLSDGLRNLKALRINRCGLTETCCSLLASALTCDSSVLRELDLDDNDLKDSGVKKLSAGLGNPNCKLETLSLSGCLITDEGCASLASALRSNLSILRELDLSYNHPGDSGVKLLSGRLEDPQCRLEKLKVDHSGECWIKPGIRKYACELTLDPNTTNRHLFLSEENRKATWSREEQPYPDHPERFEDWRQVLSTEGLSGRCYWEVEWYGGRVYIGVTYKGISRRGVGDDCKIGYNDTSWSLVCDDKSYSAWYKNKSTVVPVPSSGSHRVGVYLDWPAGNLSFYSVSSDTLTHLYTFHTTFTEPLYPGFWVWSDASVSLCQVE